MIEWVKWDPQNPPNLGSYLVTDGKFVDVADLHNFDELRWYPPDRSMIHETSISHYAEINLPSADWMQGMANKFCGVIKHDDAVKYLNDKDKADFNYLCNKVEMGRSRDGKRPVNAYLIVNVDEPYAEEVAAILKRNGHWG